VVPRNGHKHHQLVLDTHIFLLLAVARQDLQARAGSSKVNRALRLVICTRQATSSSHVGRIDIGICLL